MRLKQNPPPQKKSTKLIMFSCQTDYAWQLASHESSITRITRKIYISNAVVRRY